MKMIDHNHFICHLILGTFTEYPWIGYIGRMYPIIVFELSGGIDYFFRQGNACG